MSYEVLARKWRPQQFDQVVGQDHVTLTLRNAIETDRIAHAYLFVGPRGIGKTSVARIFAKALNCKEGPSATPCDKCDVCREITAGTCLDVLEIDGASNNGVEQVRDLRETVKYAPTVGAYKIYIIDEVHMLSVAAFNALLKTLEEPPPHVKFVFATTEPEKILPTIISRCQRFDLRRIPVSLIVDRLEQIAAEEKIKITDDALLAIARGSEGGLRDAESALDQLISFKGKEIEEEDVLSVFGLVSRAVLEKLAGHILAGEMKDVIGSVARLDEAGKDLQRAVLDLMAHFRNLLICLNVDDPEDGLDLGGSQVAVLKEQAAGTNTARVLRVTTILSETENRMRFALCRRTLLETALIRCARAATVVSLDEILSRINALRDGAPKPLKKNAAPGDSDGGAGQDSPELSPAAPAEKEPVPAPAAPAPRTDAELHMLRDRWHEIIDRVGKIAVLAKSSLVDARPAEVRVDSVVIAFDPEFAGEIKNFDAARNRKAVEHVLQSLLKRDVTVDFVAGTSEGVRAAMAEESPRPEPKGEVDKAKGGKRSRRDWVDEPTVRTVLDTFKGSIVDVRE